MKKILFLTDFSNVSNYAQDAAIMLAGNNGAELTVYHALDKNSQWIYELDSDPELFVYKQEDRSDNVSLKALSQKLQTKNIKSKLIIGSHDLVSSFESICEKHEPDLIILGATGMGTFQNELGSITRKLVKQAKKPILIIKEPMKDQRIDEIVFASKFDLVDRDKLRKCIDLLKPPSDATIHLMSVDTSSYFKQPTVLMREAMKDFEVIAYPIKAVSIFYKDYNVQSGIEHFLEEINPDILVMTHSDRNFIKSIFQTDAAIESAVSSSYPVLIIN